MIEESETVSAVGVRPATSSWEILTRKERQQNEQNMWEWNIAIKEFVTAFVLL